MCKRKIFLKEFLTLLGAESIIWKSVESDKVSGTVIYDSTDPEEFQDFCWHMYEENMPSEKVLKLISLIRENELIDIDKITVSVEELFTLTQEKNYEEYFRIVLEMLDIQVRMVDDGEETDTYFVHF